MENKEDTNLKTFNTAKLYSESILFPIMFDFKKYQRQANFGSDKLDDSLIIPEEIREIQRFNGLKGMIETVHDLLYSISSTVKLKGNKEEINKLDELIIYTEKLKKIFYEHKERFFSQEYKNGKIIEVLDRNYFNTINKIIDVCYVNSEILMTKNKLLFTDANDEFSSDEEIKEEILKRYVEG